MKKIALMPPALFLAVYVVVVLLILVTTTSVPGLLPLVTLILFALPYVWWLAVYRALKSAHPGSRSSVAENVGMHLPIAFILVSASLWITLPGTGWGRESGKFVLVSLLAALWIGASAIVRAERRNPEQLVTASLATAAQMFFLPAGIWWLHARVRRILFV